MSAIDTTNNISPLSSPRHLENSHSQVNSPNPFKRLFKPITDHFEARRLSDNSETINSRLDSAEQQATIIEHDTVMKLFEESQAHLEELHEKLQDIPALQASYDLLRVKVCSLKYRINAQNDLISVDAGTLQVKISESKKRNPVMQQFSEKEQELTEADLLKLDYLRDTYPDFATLMMENDDLADAFVTTVLMRGVTVDVFVQFTNITQTLSSLAMARFGRFQDVMKVESSDNEWQKQLTVSYLNKDRESKRVNLLDGDAKLELEGGRVYSVSQVIKHIKFKPVETGPVEVFPEGIRGFHAGAIGWGTKDGGVEQVDVTQEEWYKNLPAWETLTTEQANEKYGAYLHGEPLDGSNWMVALCASAKDSKRIDILNTHGYQVILVPQGDGTYNVLPLGKNPRKSPDMRSAMETVGFILNTIPGEIQFDYNYFTESRVHAQICYSLSADLGKDYMNSIIGRDIQAGRDGKMPFQFAGKNCIEWVMSSFKEFVEKHELSLPLPDYTIPILETDPSHPVLGKLINGIKNIAACVRNFFMNVVLLLLGARRSMTVDGISYSVWDSPTFNATNSYIINTPMPFFNYGGEKDIETDSEAEPAELSLHRVRLVTNMGI